MQSVYIDGTRWDLGAPIGSGGFARVHEAVSPDGEPAAIKLIPKDRGAERELLLPAELEDCPNVIPILATGEFEDSWVLVMPRADLSLRNYMRDKTVLDHADAVAVLTDILAALVALEGRVVHRDLKPENVLRLNGRWCLADFGIARYAEQATAADTREFCDDAYVCRTRTMALRTGDGGN